jgi:hypothetical protein
MKNFAIALLALAVLFPPSMRAQQTVPVTIPSQMLPVAITVSGLPAGCTWTAIGGVTIVVTVANCPTTPPPAPMVTSVTVSGPASTAAGSTATFTAVVVGTNSPSQAVTWAAINGSITSAGIFTPSAGATSSTVTATSVLDPTKSGTATVSITPASTTIGIGSLVQTVLPPGETVINVRLTPVGALVGPQQAGVTGTVVDGPILANGFNWWKVTFKTGPSGWVGVDALKVSGPAPPTISVTWLPSISTNLTGYNVYRGTTSGGPYAALAAIPVNANNYTDVAVLPGTQYFYVVTELGSAAVYAIPESVFSNEASASAL